MSAEMSRVLVTGGLALLTAFILALINNWISARAGVDENLRSQRLAAYPELWKETGAVSRWPRTEPTRLALEGLHRSYRSWYYSNGGLFMSEQARARYGDVQELLAALLHHSPSGPTDRLVENAYTDLMETTSALRTALTQDLDARQRRTPLTVWQRSRWHRDATKKAEARMNRALRPKSAFVISPVQHV
ncbi:hypothetical protein [Streptomyces ureilyticus]|uniref:Uncharacterized protein n=1 Tax=Streptomyces ureilyticus TaxID=1775131 RepID=A0ABX0DQM5_9ACTN|nr:hypothetical protein [Streptomyces ureilyticus]NGO43049.1 hypothetical protein [Streptomyces ureilyticus]